MKKKVIGAIAVAVVVALGTLCVIDHIRMNNNAPVFFSTWGKKYAPPLQSFSAVMCSAKSFHNSKDGAFLEIVIDNEKGTHKKLAVKDKKLIEKLSETSVEKIIGVNLVSSIPDDALSGKADYYKSDVISLLIDYDEYNKYFEVVDVSLDETSDTVKTY